MNKYEFIFELLLEAITEDVKEELTKDMKKEIYVLPDGFKVDMAEVERAEAMYKEVK